MSLPKMPAVEDVIGASFHLKPEVAEMQGYCGRYVGHVGEIHPIKFRAPKIPAAKKEKKVQGKRLRALFLIHEPIFNPINHTPTSFDPGYCSATQAVADSIYLRNLNISQYHHNAPPKVGPEAGRAGPAIIRRD